MYKIIKKLFYKSNLVGYLLSDGDNEVSITKNSLINFISSIDSSNIVETSIGYRVYAEDYKIDNFIYDNTLKNFNNSLFKANLDKYYWLVDLISHGGSTFSSGALRKWDFNGFMIKDAGDFTYSAINEAYISEVLYLTEIQTAKYGLVKIFKSEDNGEIVESLACITKLFDGVKYDVRKLLKRDTSFNDNIIKLSDIIVEDIEKQRLYDMFILDYIFVQRDRHMKNIEYLESSNGKVLSPLFDFGGCLYYDIEDEMLQNYLYLDVDRAKVESRTNLENVKFLLYLTDKIGFDLDLLLYNSKLVMEKYRGYYGLIRSKFILDLIERRIEIVRQIFSD